VFLIKQLDILIDCYTSALHAFKWERSHYCFKKYIICVKD